MIYVFIVIIVIVISQHSEPVYWSCSEDIVRHWLSYNFCEVTDILSIEWLMNCSYFCITNHMFCCDVRVCSLSDYVTWTRDDAGTSTFAITRPSVQHRALVVVSVVVRRVCELMNWLKSSTWRYCDICKLYRECCSQMCDNVRLLEFEWCILYCVHCILYWWFMYMIMWCFS